MLIIDSWRTWSGNSSCGLGSKYIMCGVRGEHKELAGTCLPITAINQLDLLAPLTPPQVVVGVAEDKEDKEDEEDKEVAKEEMAKNRGKNV